MNWNEVIECVPNSSEGRDLEKMDQIVIPSHSKVGVKPFDYSNDEDHSHLVVTLVGGPEALYEAVVEAVGVAVRLISLNQHTGQHPYMGTVDVILFIPIRNASMEEAIELSKKVAVKVTGLYNLPVFLYERLATAPHRENPASARKDEFEGMAEEIESPKQRPSFGPVEQHPAAGTTAVGARMPLITYNINLSTDNMEIATKIVKSTRHINGGLCYVKAMGVELKERNITQVSINMTDYTRTALYHAFELVHIEARRYGITVIGSEIIGLVPMEALINTASYYLGLENFTMQQVLEACIMEQLMRKQNES